MLAQIEIDEWVAGVLEMEAATSEEDFAASVAHWEAVVQNGRRVTMLRLVFSRMDADQVSLLLQWG